MNLSYRRAVVFCRLTMATDVITNGPEIEELLNRALSGLPVTFATADGALSVVIEELQETDDLGSRFWFAGETAAYTRCCRVEGAYDSLAKTGQLRFSTDGR